MTKPRHQADIHDSIIPNLNLRSSTILGTFRMELIADIQRFGAKCEEKKSFWKGFCVLFRFYLIELPAKE